MICVQRVQNLLLGLIGCAAALATAAAADAAPLTLWGAGSLRSALGTAAQDFTTATGTPVSTNFGPSGTLRQEIEAGARPDVFASADFNNPLTLEQEGIARPVLSFATNPVVAVAAPGIAVNSSNLLATLLNSSITVGTSTPVADPLGDYTEQLFAKADALNPGAKATLDAKAERLVASPTSPPVPTGDNNLVYFLDTTHQADIFLAYASDIPAALAINSNLQVVTLPSELAVAGNYGITVLNGAAPGAQALEDYILSPAGQAVLAQYGFGPPAAAVPEPASAAVLGLALAAAVAVRRRRA
jgi:ABC-type molybdate transport system substrate-binding protein